MIPYDPYFFAQWHLRNTGQTGGTPGVDIGVVPVWEDYTGRGVTVGVIDDGVDHTVPDLAPNYRFDIDHDALAGDGDAFPDGTAENHGTSVAAVIAAAGNNGLGGTGVAFEARLAGFRGMAELANLQRQTAVDISSNSWGFSTPFYDDRAAAGFAPYHQAIEAAAGSGRGGLGTVWVFAAGNSRAYGENTNHHGLTNSRFSIAVAAIDHTGAVAPFSTPGATVLVAAPGMRIATSDRESAGYPGFAASYDMIGISGTSFAAPVVSGVAALMLQANPRLGYRDVQEILAYSARRVGPDAGWSSNAAANWNGGGLHVSSDHGFGLVDARAAVRLAETWTAQGTLANERSAAASTTPNAAIPDGQGGGVTTSLTLGGDLVVDRVEVDVDIPHAFIGDLRVTLTSPGGTSSVLIDRPGQGARGVAGAGTNDGTRLTFTLGSVQFWGERAAGTWTLRVEDLAAGGTGTLASWGLRAYGDPDPLDDTYVYTDEFASGGGQSLNDADGGTDTLNAAALGAGCTVDLAAGTAVIAGRALAIAAGTIEAVLTGDGDDTLVGDSRANRLSGGRGNDTVSYAASAAAVRVDLAAGTGSGGDAEGDRLSGIESLVGSAFADALTGDARANRLEGGAGDDRLDGGDGDDTLVGGPGNDTLVGGAGTDTAVLDHANATVWVSGIETLTGGAVGQVQILLADGGNAMTVSGAQRLFGGAGNDVIRLGDAGNDLLMAAVETVLGGAGGDRVLLGDGGGRVFVSGVETLVGGAGQDVIQLGEGGNVLAVSALETVVGGGAGDRLILLGTDTRLVVAGIETISGGAGGDWVTLAGAGSTLAVADVETLRGGSGLDVVTLGDAGNRMIVAALDTLTGGAGGDWIILSNLGSTMLVSGVETLRGGAGDDAVTLGDGGNQMIVAALDTLAGGAGVDVVTLTAFGASMTVGGVESLHGGSSGDWITLAATGSTMTVTDVETLRGGSGLDVITLGDGGNRMIVAALDTLAGGAGGDWITLSHLGSTLLVSGVETLRGGTGADVITLGDGGNRMIVAALDALIGGAGLDVVTLTAFGASMTVGGIEALHGGPNGEWITLAAAGSTMTVTGVETLRGGSGADVITLGDGGNRMIVAALDTLAGGAGGDWVILSNLGSTMLVSGVETLRGGDGADVITLGGAGNTLITASLDTLAGSAGLDVVTLSDRGATMAVSGIESLTGGAAADRVTVGGGAIRFQGNGGADTVTLQAGPGSDQVVFASRDDGAAAGVAGGFDTYVNFQATEDRVVLSGALRAAVDRDGNGALAVAARSGGTVNLGTDELVILSAGVAVFDDDGFAGFLAALGGVAGSSAGAEALVLVSNGVDSALYDIVDSDGGGTIAAAETRLLARFAGTTGLTAGIFGFG